MAERWQASRVRVQRLAGRARPTTPDMTITGVKCFIFSIQEGMFFFCPKQDYRIFLAGDVHNKNGGMKVKKSGYPCHLSQECRTRATC